jgi:hypothetical protein
MPSIACAHMMKRGLGLQVSDRFTRFADGMLRVEPAPGEDEEVQLIKEGDVLTVRVLSLDMLARFPVHVTCRSRLASHTSPGAATAGLAFCSWQAARPAPHLPARLRSADAAGERLRHETWAAAGRLSVRQAETGGVEAGQGSAVCGAVTGETA